MTTTTTKTTFVWTGCCFHVGPIIIIIIIKHRVNTRSAVLGHESAAANNQGISKRYIFLRARVISRCPWQAVRKYTWWYLITRTRFSMRIHFPKNMLFIRIILSRILHNAMYTVRIINVLLVKYKSQIFMIELPIHTL